MSKKKNIKWLIILVIVALLCAVGYFVYTKYFAGAIHLKNKNYTFIYVENKGTFADVINDINAENIIEDIKAFEWLAKKMGLDKNINPGKYRITSGMTMRQIINLIKYNKQEKVKLTYNSQIHNLDEFVSYTADKLEINENEIEEYISDDSVLQKMFQLDPDNCFAMITPGVYEVSWAITLEDLFKELKNEYFAIWNASRISKAKKMGYSVADIITIASIVQSESGIASEQQKIAGVYINRLNKNMLLQADPTLKFANKNFEVKRVLDEDKEVNSPYNTYKYKGLPPGPICLVYVQSIDAVLNYTKHKYIFFCAKPSLNGYSDFSETYVEHEKYAKAYQKEMNKRGINR